MAKWDYQVIEFHTGGFGAAENITNTLKEFGNEGWEVVAVVCYTVNHTVYMKRPRDG